LQQEQINVMRLVVNLYALSTQASLLSFIVSAIWGGVLALRRKPLGENYKLALVATHVITAFSSLLLIVLALTKTLPQAGLILIYTLVALAILPCVYVYLPKDQPHYRVSGLALASLFASSMVLRALQVLQGQLLQGQTLQGQLLQGRF
jgi:predicted neutral ceramidase superfamily lipid hydrolase